MKKLSKKMLLGLVGISVLAACSGEKINDVDYYIENEAERTAKLKECANNPGTMKNSPNCENAAAAAVRTDFNTKSKSMPKIL